MTCMDQLALFDTAPLTHPSMVYVGARNGFIKIGVSVNPTARAKQLKLTLLHTQPGTRHDEHRIHQRFATDRIDREWFMASPAILHWLAS